MRELSGATLIRILIGARFTLSLAVEAQNISAMAHY